MKLAIARILKDEGYIKDFELPAEERREFRVWLKYGSDKKPVMTGLKRVSKPGLRVYSGPLRSADGARRPGRGDRLHLAGHHDRPGSLASATSAAKCSATSGKA